MAIGAQRRHADRVGGDEEAVTATRSRRAGMAWVSAAVLFLAMAIAETWPFALHPGSTMPGPMGGDVSISVAKFQLYADEGVSPFLTGSLRTVGWPEGVATTPSLDVLSGLSTGFLYLGAILVGSVAAHGLLAILGYALTGLVTFGFVRDVTGSAAAGLIAGLAYAGAANLTINIWAVTVYAQGWLFVLCMWAAWRLAVRPSLRIALLLGLAYLASLFWTPYFALHAAVVAGASVAVAVLVPTEAGAGVGRRLRLAAVSAAVWLAGVAAYLALNVATGFADVPERALTDHFDKSAHPLMYLVPGAFAKLWGPGPSEWLTEQVPRALSLNLYLGASVIVLSVVAVVALLGPWLRRRGPMTPVQVATLIAGAVALACMLFSLPPRVLDGRVPMPGYLVAELAPQFRTPLRFVMAVLAGTSVLAGLGAFVLLRHVRGHVLAAGLTVAIGLVIVLDTLVVPPESWVRTPTPSGALAELREAPDGPAIHYLSTGFLDSPAPRACFVAREHRKPIANACAIRLDRPPRLVAWETMPVCGALRAERDAGIRYVIADVSRPDVGDCLTGNPALGRVLATDDQLTVFALRP